MGKSRSHSTDKLDSVALCQRISGIFNSNQGGLAKIPSLQLADCWDSFDLRDISILTMIMRITAMKTYKFSTFSMRCAKWYVIYAVLLVHIERER